MCFLWIICRVFVFYKNTIWLKKVDIFSFTFIFILLVSIFY
ncbi:hypothetical protein KKH3_35500 [Pectobacterium actinidiae]|nr:hypothetical protein KKH3_35500 [Pectobacterium actinidiae]